MKAISDTPDIFKKFGGIIAAQSTRLGGVSPLPYESLNLGLSTSDKKEHVLENRRRFFSSLGIDESEVAFSGQVHGKKILVAHEPGKSEGYDAIITNKKNVFVAVGVADCAPVLVYDPITQAVAAIHAGWRGTVQQIVFLTLQQMKAEYGTAARNCYAWIGTCISECAFEVGAEVAEAFDREFVRWDDNRKKHFVDLKKANKKQLVAAGIPGAQIEVATNCTVANNDRYFSYRSEGKDSGRMLAVIGLR